MSIYSQGCITYGEHQQATLDYDDAFHTVSVYGATLDRIEQVNSHTYALWFDYDGDPFAAYSQYGDVIINDTDE